jgi:hypothetical protein
LAEPCCWRHPDPCATPALTRALVIGEAVAAGIALHEGRATDADERALQRIRILATRAARVLHLGFAGIDVAELDGELVVVGASGSPALGTFETVTGTMLAEQLIAFAASKVRSWVRRSDALATETASAGANGAPEAKSLSGGFS